MNIRDKKQSYSDKVSRYLGSFVLLFFIFFEQLWIGTAACAAAFIFFYVMQVFVEKTKTWYGSLYLYGSIGCAVLAWLEYKDQIISNLLGL